MDTRNRVNIQNKARTLYRKWSVLLLIFAVVVSAATVGCAGNAAEALIPAETLMTGIRAAVDAFSAEGYSTGFLLYNGTLAYAIYETLGEECTVYLNAGRGGAQRIGAKKAGIKSPAEKRENICEKASLLYLPII